MTATTTVPVADAPEPSPRPPLLKRRRVRAMAIWTVLFLVQLGLIGLPTDPAYAFGWLWAATIAWNSDRPWRSHLRFARDWVPIALLLTAYNVSRGFADDGVVPHALEMVWADQWMFGWFTGGVVPTVWLQHHLYDPAHIRWYDVLVSFVYFSHFVTTFVVATVLWLRNRGWWATFVRRWFTLSVLGLGTYFLYPAAPPWWAAQYGIIEPVARISTRGWKAIGLHGAGGLLGAAQLNLGNPVAAMPSLHSAYALMVVAFFLPRVARRWWPLLLLYPLAMTFSLIYSGEHYFADVLVGWAYVGLTLVIVRLFEYWWIHRKRSPEPSP